MQLSTSRQLWLAGVYICRWKARSSRRPPPGYQKPAAGQERPALPKPGDVRWRWCLSRVQSPDCVQLRATGGEIEEIAHPEQSPESHRSEATSHLAVAQQGRRVHLGWLKSGTSSIGPCSDPGPRAWSRAQDHHQARAKGQGSYPNGQRGRGNWSSKPAAW